MLKRALFKQLQQWHELKALNQPNKSILIFHQIRQQNSTHFVRES